MNRIYLDWNATAPLLPEVKAAMIAALDDAPGNASSIHREGQRARSVIERTRRAIARAINAPPQAVVLCGGATEGNNQILRTHAAFAGQKLGKKPLIVCTSVEHTSVSEVGVVLGGQGVQVALLGVDRGRRHSRTRWWCCVVAGGGPCEVLSGGCRRWHAKLMEKRGRSSD